MVHNENENHFHYRHLDGPCQLSLAKVQEK